MDFKLVSEFKPTGDQPQAIKQLVKGLLDDEQYQTLLGVTGSGKTEVYLRAMEKVVEDNGGVILLVPEVALAPQTVGRVRSGMRVVYRQIRRHTPRYCSRGIFGGTDGVAQCFLERISSC